MSFGFSLSDVFTLAQITARTFRRWQVACGKYGDVVRELATLSGFLEQIKTDAQKSTSLLHRDEGDLSAWKTLESDCTTTLTKLEGYLNGFKTLGTDHAENWKRLRFNSAKLATLRKGLEKHTSNIATFVQLMSTTATGRIESQTNALKSLPGIERALNEITSQIRAGKREGSINLSDRLHRA